MLKIKPIKTEQDYKDALKAIDNLWEAQFNTPDGDDLEILITLVEKYESEHFHIDNPDPIEAIKFIMEQKHMARKDLELILGTKSRVTEILKKQRKLNLNMMRKLHSHLQILYEILMEDYNIKKQYKAEKYS